MPTELLGHARAGHKDGLSYEHRPKPFSRTLELTFDGRRLVARRGEREMIFALADIERVRLAFAPRNVAHRAFDCHVRRKDGVGLRFDSLSWKSLVEAERQDGAYTTFVIAFVSACVAGNVPVEAGIGAVRHTLAKIAGVTVALALIGTAFAAWQREAIAASGFALALLAYFGWWLTDFVKRNRPVHVATVSDIPAGVLPEDETVPRR